MSHSKSTGHRLVFDEKKSKIAATKSQETMKDSIQIITKTQGCYARSNRRSIRGPPCAHVYAEKSDLAVHRSGKQNVRMKVLFSSAISKNPFVSSLKDCSQGEWHYFCAASAPDTFLFCKNQERDHQLKWMVFMRKFRLGIHFFKLCFGGPLQNLENGK